MICGTNALAMEAIKVTDLLVSPTSDVYELGSVPSGVITAVFSDGSVEDVSSKISTDISVITIDTTAILYSFKGASVSQTVSNVKKTVFPGSIPVLKGGSNNGSYTISDSEYFVKVNQASTNETSPILSLAIDATDFSKITINAKRMHAWNWTNVGYWLLSAANWKSGTNYGVPSTYLASGVNRSKCAFIYEKTTGGTSYNVTESLDYDISSLTGTYYLDIGTYAHSDNQDKREAIVRVYSVELFRD